MLEIKDEEEDPSMSLDMAKLLDFCCKNQLEIFCFADQSLNIYKTADDDVQHEVLELKFSDLYYPKNLLRTLKEKINNE